MTRKELIEEMLDRRLDGICQAGSAEEYLRLLFLHGANFDGYEEYTDAELIEEWNVDAYDDDERIESLDSEESAA